MKQIGRAESSRMPCEIQREDPDMQTQRIVLSLAIAIGGGLFAAAPALSQEERGTWEQQMACTPDVMRLCSDQIPDTGRIVACLRQNTALLGHSCRAVFESNASAQQQPGPQPPMARAPQPMQPHVPQQIQPAPVAPLPDDDDE
ncbi:hypothetical protein UP10_25210 [Bradyrhizobium sp. LTSPM299]|nr:hypothetical protein UP10_25210 [Bradyrhizobium sp. LTSPM299]